jgi:hypothetical protein
MATTKENKEKKKVNLSSSSKGNQKTGAKSAQGDPSQKESSNVGKGPAGENL